MLHTPLAGVLRSPCEIVAKPLSVCGPANQAAVDASSASTETRR
jgi:hypothetical protein